MWKKTYLFFFVLVVILFLFPFRVNGQSVPLAPKVPGVDCGIAGAGNNIDSCCYSTGLELPQLPGWVQDPFNVTSGYNDKIKEINGLQKNSQTPCIYGAPDPAITDYASPNCKCILQITPTPLPAIGQLCAKYITGQEYTACLNCAKGGGYWSGMACFPTRLDSFITDFILSVGIGIAGLAALLCIIYSVLRIQTSRGNPEAIKKAQETMTSCIIGLILIIFSAFLLRLIGVTILRIPGFQ